MRFAGIKELKHKTMNLINESKKKGIFITAYGKPVDVLHHITEDDLAAYLIGNDPAFKNRIEEAFADYTAQGGITAETMIKIAKQKNTSLIAKTIRCLFLVFAHPLFPLFQISPLFY